MTDVALTPSGGGLRFELRDASITAGGRSAGRGGRALLDSCYASFPAGTLCAVMGPSGSGKTVLLNVLRGRAPGTVRAGGNELWCLLIPE